ncbi:hypothetical protein E5288_WYG008551 [Bos mutus]|uniref:Uncharacterized protein n=1 Tax=Bos mutus TaxID=72004 RepID=A0A6B0RXS1_9CETA|nr:hypothetical protein [Bos mutus]
MCRRYRAARRFIVTQGTSEHLLGKNASICFSLYVLVFLQEYLQQPKVQTPQKPIDRRDEWRSPEKQTRCSRHGWRFRSRDSVDVPASSTVSTEPGIPALP